MDIFIISMFIFVIGMMAMSVQAIPNVLFALVAVIICIVIIYRITVFLEKNLGFSVAFVFVLIVIFVPIIGFRIYYNSDLVASIYVVTSDSNYVKEEDMGFFGPIRYTTLYSGTIVSWVYHDSYAYPKGEYYIYTGKDNYRALTDFCERGNQWHLKYIKKITYKEFKNSKWWEDIKK